MRLITPLLVLGAWLAAGPAVADPEPARGKLLVATDSVSGDLFNETVILLLHYDRSGAMGLVINRPTEVKSEEFLAHAGTGSAYDGPLFWGGPVMMNMLNGLVRSDSPPEGGKPLIDSVYYLHAEDALAYEPGDDDDLRLYIGYAGWGAGQLDRELARGSWQILPASADIVFTVDPRALWERLAERQEYRAALRSGQVDRCRSNCGRPREIKLKFE